MKSIKNKILVVVIAGLLVITAVVSMIAVNMTHEVMHKDADRILKNVAQKEAAYINDALGDVQKSAAVMEHYAKGEITTISQLQEQGFCEQYLEKAERMFGEVALNTNGLEGFFMRINPDYSDGTTGFYSNIDENNQLKQMPLTDLSKYDENDTQNVGWYYTAVKEGQAVWLEPYRFPGLETRLISYVVPIYIEDELLGIIGFDMDFEYLLKRIEAIEVYEKGYAVLLGKDAQTSYIQESADQSDNPHTHAGVGLENGMYLELRADYQDIQKDIRPMLRKIVVAFVIVLIASIFYTIFVTNRIVFPLKQLTKAAKKASSGIGDVDFAHIPVDSKDEIGTLSRVLASSYKKIQEYTTYINALAYRDSLTGIKNSTAYIEAVAELNKEICCGNPQFGVLVADINNLKETNDKYGHDIGNDLIVHTVNILTSIFKNSPIFRIGGDEFAVILKGQDLENYRTFVEQMDEACRADHISVGEHVISVSVARGVALYNSAIDRVYEDVFAKADHAMYLNKAEGKRVALEVEG